MEYRRTQNEPWLMTVPPQANKSTVRSSTAPVWIHSGPTTFIFIKHMSYYALAYWKSMHFRNWLCKTTKLYFTLLFDFNLYYTDIKVSFISLSLFYWMLCIFAKYRTNTSVITRRFFHFIASLLFYS